MKLYADLPARRAVQVCADVAMVVWIVLCFRVGTWIDDLVMELAGPGRRMVEAGSDFQAGLDGAGDSLAGLPLVPDAVRSPFGRAGDAGGSLRSAGEAQVSAVDTIATVLGVLVAVLAILVVLVRWFPARARFVLEATRAQRLLATGVDLDLFALRAIVRQPLAALSRVHEDPAAAWRAGDPEAVRRLAALELGSLGLRADPAADIGDHKM